MSKVIVFDINKILKWNKWHITFILFVSVFSLLFNDLILLAITAILSFGFYIYFFRVRLSQYSPFAGYANLVTLFRAYILIASMFFWDEVGSMFLFIIFSIVAGLDWLDGFVAKKFDLKSDFGLYLDMETDSLLVAVMSFILWKLHDFHWVVLISGFMRYPYAFVVMLLLKEPKKEPKRPYASIIAGFFYIALLLNFVLFFDIGRYLLYLSSALIIASFARSFCFQISGNKS